MLTQEEIIDWLNLKPNDFEGGFFAETYKSSIRIPDKDLSGFPATENGRPLSSSIYYFVTKDSYSVLHRVTGDMTYHFYYGQPIEILLLYPDNYPNHSETCILSNDISIGGLPMKTIPGGTWIGSRMVLGGSYALMGVTMSPGFHPNDYSIGRRAELIKVYPERELLITVLSKN